MWAAGAAGPTCSHHMVSWSALLDSCCSRAACASSSSRTPCAPHRSDSTSQQSMDRERLCTASTAGRPLARAACERRHSANPYFRSLLPRIQTTRAHMSCSVARLLPSAASMHSMGLDTFLMPHIRTLLENKAGRAVTKQRRRPHAFRPCTGEDRV